MPSLVKRLILKRALGQLPTLTCHRWSVVAPFIVYIILFGTVKLSSIPLRSTEAGAVQPAAVRRLQQVVTEKRIFKPIDGTPPQTLLENIFKKADVNKDGFLSSPELSTWINNKTQEHIHQAMIENYGLFTQIDMDPKNGVITWNEYHQYFLQQHGYPIDEDATSHNGNAMHPELTRDLRETIMRDKAAWGEAARSDPDHLTVDEFLAFRHPESSHATILTLVEDLLDKFDRDGDGSLTEDEFSSLQKDDEDDAKSSPVEAERRKEFREAIDVSKDGRASRHEILMYIDPKNPRHGREEADTLVLLADADHDGKLTLDEVLEKMDLFLGSKMVDTAGSFHDEF